MSGEAWSVLATVQQVDGKGKIDGGQQNELFSGIY